MNEITYFEMLESAQEEEFVPKNLSEMNDEEILEYEEYCNSLEQPYSDDELNRIARELNL